MKEIVELYTDGACRGNPGPGGWGVLLRYKGVEKTLFGAEEHTTNNRMELMAAIKGLEALKRPSTVAIYTDSEYLHKGITQWISTWTQKGWKNSAGKQVKNRELWEALALVSDSHKIEWHWVKGHSGHPENEIADSLANEAIDTLLRK